MTADLFTAVDDYVDSLFAPSDPALDAALAAAAEAGLPDIHVSGGQGKFLWLAARLCGARRILEVGTLAGYSTIWLARAVPEGGRVVTLEFDPRHAEVAQANLARAGLSGRVEVRVGDARDILPDLVKTAGAPFDLVFLDADKISYPLYLDWALQLTRPGGLILADNVVRGGRVLDPPPGDTSAEGAAAFNAKLAAEPRLESLVLQQVGRKGHDGLAIARVRPAE